MEIQFVGMSASNVNCKCNLFDKVLDNNPDRIEIWKCWFLRTGENRSTRRKPLGARTRTNNKLNPHISPSPGIEPGPHWWEACEHCLWDLCCWGTAMENGFSVFSPKLLNFLTKYSFSNMDQLLVNTATGILSDFSQEGQTIFTQF